MNLNQAIEAAVNKLEARLPRFTESFTGTCSVNYRYTQNPNNNWVCGMNTGCYWLAYELTGCLFLAVLRRH